MKIKRKTKQNDNNKLTKKTTTVKYKKRNGNTKSVNEY